MPANLADLRLLCVWCAFLFTFLVIAEEKCQDVSGVVRNIKTINRTAHFIGLEWEPPSQAPPHCVSGYQVRFWLAAHSSPNMTQVTIVDKPEVQLTNLHACAKYQIEVSALSLNGHPGLPAVVVLRTGFSRPWAPRNLSVVRVEEGIHLSWLRPVVNPYCVSSYLISVRLAEAEEATNASGDGDADGQGRQDGSQYTKNGVISSIMARVSSWWKVYKTCIEMDRKHFHVTSLCSTLADGRAPSANAIDFKSHDHCTVADGRPVASNPAWTAVLEEWKVAAFNDTQCVNVWLFPEKKPFGIVNPMFAAPDVTTQDDTDTESTLLLKGLPSNSSYRVSAISIGEDQQMSQASYSEIQEAVAYTNYKWEITVSYFPGVLSQVAIIQWTKKPNVEDDGDRPFCVSINLGDDFLTCSECENSYSCRLQTSELNHIKWEDYKWCTKYAVRVEFSNGVGIASHKSETPEDARPEIVFVAVQVGTYECNVTWRAKAESCPPPKVTLQYCLGVCGENIQCTTTYPIGNSHFIKPLKPCTNYCVHIQAGQPVMTFSKDFRTLSEEPDPPSDFEARADDRSITVSWNRPKEKFQCINEYAIELVPVITVSSNSPTPPSGDYFTIPMSDFRNRDEVVSTTGTYETALSYTENPSSIAIRKKELFDSLSASVPARNCDRACSYKFYGVASCALYEASIMAVTNTDGPHSEVRKRTVSSSAPARPINGTILERKRTSARLRYGIKEVSLECGVVELRVVCHSTVSVEDIKVGTSCKDDWNGTPETWITNLSPNTSYKCVGLYRNSINIMSEASDPLEFTTLDLLPPLPLNVKIDKSTITSTSFELSWDTAAHEVVELCDIELTLVRAKYPIPQSCPPLEPVKGPFTVVCTNATSSIVFENLHPFAEYKVNLRSRDSLGSSAFTSDVFATTLEDKPGEISMGEYEPTGSEDNIIDIGKENCTEDLEVAMYWANQMSKSEIGTFRWMVPCRLNSPTTIYYCNVLGKREGWIEDLFDFAIHLSDELVDKVHEQEFSLKPGYSYTVLMVAQVLEASMQGAIFRKDINVPSRLPMPPSEKAMQAVKIDPSSTVDPTRMAKFEFPRNLFNETYSHILFYAILLSEAGYESPPKSCSTPGEERKWPKSSTWKEAQLQEHSLTYQTTKEWWSPFAGVNNTVRPDGDTSTSYIALYYVLGSELSCEYINGYCNGPLKPSTKYSMRIRAFSETGFTDSPLVHFETFSEPPWGVYLGVIFGGLVCIIALFIVLCKLARPRQGRGSRLFKSGLPQPIPVNKFSSVCADLLHRGDCGSNAPLTDEFELLAALSAQHAANCPSSVARSPQNKYKNRYVNVVPFDSTRVQLKDDDDPESDYINASYIKGFTGEIEYIAAQGPKEETTRDFWRMIFLENVRIIVMSTHLVEQEKVKCHQYFPELNEHVAWRDMVIGCSSQDDLAAYTLRTIVLQKGGQRRLIQHLHFRDWPDFGCPENPRKVLHLCRSLRQYAHLFPGPIVVHCSAGVGRTGTLIAVDILLQAARQQNKLDVFGTVLALREQRALMVQTAAQYVFIYRCLQIAIDDPAFRRPGLWKRSRHSSTYRNYDTVVSNWADTNI